MPGLPRHVLDQYRRQRHRQQHFELAQEVGAGAAALGTFGFLLNHQSSPPNKKRKNSADLRVTSKRLRFEPPVQTSFNNLLDTTTTGMDGGNGSGNAAGLKETPVDDVYNVNRGPPDYTFASLPFLRESVVLFNDVLLWDQPYRMTSPYDCTRDTTITDINPDGVGTSRMVVATTDSATRQARWWDFYAGMYNYYHVVSCRYNIRVENLSTEPFHAYVMFCNDSIPPTGATNQDIQLWSGVQHKNVGPVGYAVQSDGFVETAYIRNLGNTDQPNQENVTTYVAGDDTYQSGNMLSAPGSSTCSFSGEYRPGQFKREIRNDAEVENWSLTNTNPALPEHLLLRVKPWTDEYTTTGAGVAGDDLKFRLWVQLEYLVEFKELKDGLRWPVQRQPQTVTIAQDPTSTS
jgi:hypothetical protein